MIFGIAAMFSRYEIKSLVSPGVTHTALTTKKIPISHTTFQVLEWQGVVAQKIRMKESSSVVVGLVSACFGCFSFFYSCQCSVHSEAESILKVVSTEIILHFFKKFFAFSTGLVVLSVENTKFIISKWGNVRVWRRSAWLDYGVLKKTWRLNQFSWWLCKLLLGQETWGEQDASLLCNPLKLPY